MAISINWGTKVIFVPQADLTFVSGTDYNLDLNTFRLSLHALQDNEQGIVYDETHRHVAPITVGGVTLARVLEIINGYTVTFENGSYTVNLIGANSNVGDVVNLNSVSVRSANSAGLVSLAEIQAALQIINVGVQDSSLLIPHTTNLP